MGRKKKSSHQSSNLERKRKSTTTTLYQFLSTIHESDQPNTQALPVFKFDPPQTVTEFNITGQAETTPFDVSGKSMDETVTHDIQIETESERAAKLVEYYVALNANKISDEIVEGQDDTFTAATEVPSIESQQEVTHAEILKTSAENVVPAFTEQDLLLAEESLLKLEDESKKENLKLESERKKEIFQKSVWNDVKNREEFIAVFLRIKSFYEDMNQCLDDFKESLKEIDEIEMVKWITNGDDKLNDLFNDKNKYPKTEAEITAILICEQEIYCKERAKGPAINSISGRILNFITLPDLTGIQLVYTGKFKIEAMREAQLDLLTHGVVGFADRINNTESNLHSFKNKLLENNSDSKKFIDQAIQLDTAIKMEKSNLEKELKSGLRLFASDDERSREKVRVDSRTEVNSKIQYR